MFKNQGIPLVYLVQLRVHQFHHSGWCKKKLMKKTIIFLEPIGGAVPKFAHESKGSILLKELNQAISLSCPAQGFPVPSFRFVKFTKIF